MGGWIEAAIVTKLNLLIGQLSNLPCLPFSLLHFPFLSLPFTRARTRVAVIFFLLLLGNGRAFSIHVIAERL